MATNRNSIWLLWGAVILCRLLCQVVVKLTAGVGRHLAFVSSPPCRLEVRLQLVQQRVWNLGYRSLDELRKADRAVLKLLNRNPCSKREQLWIQSSEEFVLRLLDQFIPKVVRFLPGFTFGLLENGRLLWLAIFSRRTLLRWLLVILFAELLFELLSHRSIHVRFRWRDVTRWLWLLFLGLRVLFFPLHRERWQFPYVWRVEYVNLKRIAIVTLLFVNHSIVAFSCRFFENGYINVMVYILRFTWILQ